MKESTKINNGLKLFVVLIGLLIWFPLAYYSYMFANWQAYYFIESSIIVKIIFLIIILLIWIIKIHKIFYAMFFVTMNYKYGNLLYCLTGMLATIAAYFSFLKNKPIYFNSEQTLSLLKTTDESLISKSITLSIYFCLMFIFITNYCFFPFFNKKS